MATKLIEDAVRAEVIKILRAMESGKKLKSYYRFWNWMQPYTVKLQGKEIEPKVCDFLYREKIVEVEKIKGDVRWLKIANNGLELLATKTRSGRG